MIVAIIFILVKEDNRVPLIFSIAFFANYLILYAFESRLNKLNQDSKANDEPK